MNALVLQHKAALKRYRQRMKSTRILAERASYLGAARAIERLVMRLCLLCAVRINDLPSLQSHAKASHPELMSDPTLDY
jgi:hypothetical protein